MSPFLSKSYVVSTKNDEMGYTCYLFRLVSSLSTLSLNLISVLNLYRHRIFTFACLFTLNPTLRRKKICHVRVVHVLIFIGMQYIQMTVQLELKYES